MRASGGPASSVRSHQRGPLLVARLNPFLFGWGLAGWARDAPDEICARGTQLGAHVATPPGHHPQVVSSVDSE